MNFSTGLNRLGTLFKILGYICIALPIIAAINKPDAPGNSYLFILFGLSGAGLWAVGWVIQGFAKSS